MAWDGVRRRARAFRADGAASGVHVHSAPAESRTLPTTRRWLPAVALAVAIGLAYANTFSVPFVFDDVAAITQNPSLSGLGTALFPPAGLSTTGRPLVNLSLALNHAISGESPRSYHALNLALHLGNSLLLFALLRLTFRRLANVSDPAQSELAALAATAVWALHPLHTAAVTYVMQRSELLVSGCSLLTVYAFARSHEPGLRPHLWRALSVGACLAGMACKEVMVTAPVAVLLYDGLIVSTSVRSALRARPGYYAALAATWLLLAGLLLGTDARGASAGFGAGVAWLDYALTQVHAVALYLRLAIWPASQVFDYGDNLCAAPATLLLPGLVLALLLAGTAWALRRAPALGLGATWFFLLLAPTTSFVPIATQTMAEHRVYLALAGPIAAGTFLLHRAFPHSARFALLALALVLGITTFTRNADYRSASALWRDTVDKIPTNARAHYNLGISLLVAGPERNAEQAIAEMRATLRLDPGHAFAPAKLGATLLELGRFAEAMEPLSAAVRQHPDDGTLRYQLAGALLASGRIAEAEPHLAEAVRRDPTHAAAHYNYGRALTDLGQYDAALIHFETAARLDPSDASARANAARLREFLAK